jgi:hypothetical protein
VGVMSTGSDEGLLYAKRDGVPRLVPILSTYPSPCCGAVWNDDPSETAYLQKGSGMLQSSWSES